MYMFSVWMNNKIRVLISVYRFEIVNLAKWEFLQNSTHYHINMYSTNDHFYNTGDKHCLLISNRSL